jgi:hypothetical protein
MIFVFAYDTGSAHRGEKQNMTEGGGDDRPRIFYKSIYTESVQVKVAVR